MLDEIEALLLMVPPQAEAEQYRRAIMEDNVLHKATASNREKTFKFLPAVFTRWIRR